MATSGAIGHMQDPTPPFPHTHEHAHARTCNSMCGSMWPYDLGGDDLARQLNGLQRRGLRAVVMTAEHMEASYIALTVHCAESSILKPERTRAKARARE